MATRPATVGILGGMGPAAGAGFVQHFVEACHAIMTSHGQIINDQAFPEHWLAQVSVPDRTDALLDGGATPLPGMVAGLRKLVHLGVTAVAIPCNTAHAWFDELQGNCPEVELLHIVKETVRKLASDRVTAVGLMATLGTHRAGLYEAELAEVGIRCHVPNAAEQRLVMRGIFDGVKSGNLVLARSLFEGVGQNLIRRHGVSTLVLACTEIPLALKDFPSDSHVNLLDTATVLAQALADRAYA